MAFTAIIVARDCPLVIACSCIPMMAAYSAPFNMRREWRCRGVSPMNDDTKLCLIVCGSAAAVIITIALAVCYYNVTVDSAAMAAGLQQDSGGRWVKR